MRLSTRARRRAIGRSIGSGGSAPDVIEAGLATALATAAYYWRFRVPITIAAGVGALVAAILAGIILVFPDLDVRVFDAVGLILGLGVFALAMHFDMADPARQTRRADIAFWLHLLAAPLIVHSLISAIEHGRTFNSTSAIAVLGIFVVLGLVSLVIDRRALLASGLAYAGGAFGVLIQQTDLADKAGAATLLLLGLFILLLSAGWRPLRAALLQRFAHGLHPTPSPSPHENVMTDFSPREIVSELDRFIVGQKQAKRAVAIALRNRWRRLHLEGAMRDEVMPKNILMIGPTGCGKTEISRRLAKLANAPFLKVEATKFTEVGYVGRDVEQIIRDLLEIAIAQVKQNKRKALQARAHLAAEERLLDALVGANASQTTRDAFRKKLRSGELAEKEIEIELAQPSSGMPMFELPNMPGASIGAISIGDIFGKGLGKPSKPRRLLVKDALEPLIAEESDKLMDQDQIVQEAIHEVENNGIVFLDEIDKICAREGRGGADVSREGVQRDLLPLIEGTTVSTKHGAVKTDHVLFIASGAFHIAKPSDLLPELQGRLPIRVELSPLDEEDFRRILTETEASLIKQYQALMKTEGVDLVFTPDGVNAIAKIAVQVNSSVENIGARRLQTVMERVLDEVSYSAPDRSGELVEVTGEFVEKNIGDLARNSDLSRFIL